MGGPFGQARGTPAADFLIGLFPAQGDFGSRQVGDRGQHRLDFGGERLVPFLARLDVGLQGRDFGQQFIGIATLALDEADLARGIVASRLHHLQFGLQRPARAIKIEDGFGRRGKTTPRKAGVESGRVVADQFQVVHGIRAQLRRRAQTL